MYYDMITVYLYILKCTSIMKINNLRIKALLLSALPMMSTLPLAAQVVQDLTDEARREYYEIVAYSDDDSATGTLGEKPGRYLATILDQLGSDDKVIMNIGVVEIRDDKYLLPTTSINAGEIHVERWSIYQGDREQNITINSTISGDGTIEFRPLDTSKPSAHQTYQFSGDMSNYGGALLGEGVTVEFTGSTRGSLISGDTFSGAGGGVAGRGFINVIGDPMSSAGGTVAFSIDAGGTSYVTNERIIADHIQFNNSTYAVTGLLEARDAFSVGAGAHVTMLSKSALEVDGATSLTVDAAGSLSFDSGSVLSAALGTTIDAAITMESGALLRLVAGSETSLTLSDISWRGGMSGGLGLIVRTELAFMQGRSYNLLNMDMTDLSTSDFSVNLSGLEQGDYTLSLEGNVLTATILNGAYDLRWNGAERAVWSTENTSQAWSIVGESGTRNFRDYDIVRFETASEAQTVMIEGAVSASAINVNSDTDYSFAGYGEISGEPELIKAGAGRLTINIDFEGLDVILLNEGVLSISHLPLHGGPLIFNGGTLALHGGETVVLEGHRLVLNGTDTLKLELDGTDAKLVDAELVSAHRLHVTAREPSDSSLLFLTHDSWNDVTSAHIGAGVTVDFGTTHDYSPWVAKGLTGSGTLVSSHSAEASHFVVATSSAEGKFTGTLQADNGADIGLALTHDDAASRMSLVGTEGTRFSVYNQGADTLYLKGLSGAGVFSFSEAPSSEGRSTVNLEMQRSQTFAGSFEHDAARMGNFVVSALGDYAGHALTLSGAGYATKSSDESWHQMHVSNASVRLSGADATWGGVIDLKDDLAALVFFHTEAHVRDAEAGKITGAGSVEIRSVHEVTLSGNNDYSGGTFVGGGASLTLESANAAGTGQIRLDEGAKLTADGLSMSNALALGGRNTISGNVTFSGDTSLFYNTTLTATDTVTLSGRLLTDEGEVLTLQSGSFIFSGAEVDASALKFSESVNLTLASSTLTGIEVTPPQQLGFTPTGREETTATIYTLTNLAHLLAAATEGVTLVLDALPSTRSASSLVGFEIEGLSSLPFDFGLINLKIGGQSYQLSGATSMGLVGSSNMVLYYNHIPEPSTATLSLLALAGLLARRRRRG